jgi:hypothetical protein
MIAQQQKRIRSVSLLAQLLRYFDTTADLIRNFTVKNPENDILMISR